MKCYHCNSEDRCGNLHNFLSFRANLQFVRNSHCIILNYYLDHVHLFDLEELSFAPWIQSNFIDFLFEQQDFLERRETFQTNSSLCDPNIQMNLSAFRYHHQRVIETISPSVVLFCKMYFNFITRGWNFAGIFVPLSARFALGRAKVWRKN